MALQWVKSKFLGEPPQKSLRTTLAQEGRIIQSTENLKDKLDIITEAQSALGKPLTLQDPMKAVDQLEDRFNNLVTAVKTTGFSMMRLGDNTKHAKNLREAMVCFTRLVPYIRNQIDLARLNLLRQQAKNTNGNNGSKGVDTRVISDVLDLKHFVMFESDVFSDVITHMSFRSEDVVPETAIVVERPPIYVEGKPEIPKGDGPRWLRDKNKPSHEEGA